MPAPPPDVVAALRAAGCVFAEDEAVLIVEAAPDAAQLGRLLARRVAGEPLEQVLGWAEFCGLRVPVAPGVFVPRRRTAALVDAAAAVTGPGDVVVDVACGSGAIALALAGRVPPGELHATDVDPAAVRLARRTLAPVGGRVHRGDLLDALPADLRGRVDLLVANVPYVPTAAVADLPPEARDHEPRRALDGGDDGLDVARRLLAGAPEWLAPGGHVLVETSADQAGAAVAAARAAGLTARATWSDEHETSVLTATAPGSRGAPTAGVRIREATVADAAGCAAVYGPYVTGTAVSFEAEPPSPDEVAARIAAAWVHHAWVVAEQAGRVVGYACATAYSPRAAYRWTAEVSVYLDPGARGTGLGRALYEALFARLVARGLRRVVAGTTLPNPASEGLHRALGFTSVGVLHRVGWKAGAWHDVARLERSLVDDTVGGDGSAGDGSADDDPPDEPV